MKNKTKNKKAPLKINYIYLEPKTEEEAREQERKLERAFDVLFDLVLGENAEKEQL